MTTNASILIKDQVPDFVLEDHPRFVSFLEAYYEFLDNSYPNNSNISDVDLSLSQFENEFYNSFIPYIPRDVKINKEFIFKNILPLFLSKGSEKSFKYFFRLLFDKDVEIDYPGRNILKASDGRWRVENILKVIADVYSEYTGNGVDTTYYLPDTYQDNELTITIDSLEVSSGFSVYPEYKKIVFDTPPSLNSSIKISYNSFVSSLIDNRKILGKESGATAIVEKSGTRRTSATTFFELLINTKTLSGNFINGEFLSTDVAIDDRILPITLETFANVDKITITNPGVSYNIGDPVIIRGDSKKIAVAIIDEVTSGVIENLLISEGGSGFVVNDNIYAEGYTTTDFKAHILTVNDSGLSQSNTIVYNTDLISNTSDTLISAADYLFGSNVVNANTTLESAFNMVTIDHLGSITSTLVDNSYISSQISPKIYVEEHILYANTTIKDLGAIGKINIANSGNGYEVGDTLIFTNTLDFSGQGADAYVSDVSNTGGIEFIRFNSGGFGYQYQALPVITINSANGVGANIVVTSLMGSGELLTPITSNVPYGMIQSIKVLDGGIGYAQAPGIDLTGYGDGSATAEASIRNSYNQLEGKWVTSDGLLSTKGIVLQGRDYFIDYSYILKIEEEFNRFKDILKKTIHPAGMVAYSQYLLESKISQEISEDISSELEINNPDPIMFFDGFNFTGISSYTGGPDMFMNDQDILTMGAINVPGIEGARFSANTYYDTTSEDLPIIPYTEQPTRIGDSTFESFNPGITFKKYDPNRVIDMPRWLCDVSSTNLLTYSNSLLGNGYTSSNGTIEIADIQSPANTTAYKWYPTSTNLAVNTRLLRIVSSVVGSYYSVSVYVKSAGKRWLYLVAPAASSSEHNCWFDLYNGVIGTKKSLVTNAQINDIGNGWFRCSVSSKATALSSYIYLSVTNDDNTTSVTNNGTDGIYLYGIQYE